MNPQLSEPNPGRPPPTGLLPRSWAGIGLLLALLAGGCASGPGILAPDANPPAPQAAEPMAAAAATVARPADEAAVPTAVKPAAEVANDELNDPATAPPLVLGRLPTAADTERGDLWARVRGGFALADIDGDLVRKWEQHYAGQPDYMQRMVERGSRYLFHVIEEIDKRGMPAELALLPFIESAFNPQAVSRAQASGMWQFMPATGQDFDLRQNLFRDDRRDVLASTRAALDYLQQLNGMFGDWQLALAAYNWGQGNVLKAQARNRRARLDTGYTSLRMPDETRNYVPKLQAMKNLIARPEAFGLNLPRLDNHPYFLSVALYRDIDVALAARLAGLSLDEFHQLNPQLNKPVILAAGTPQVLLPYDNANRFLRELALVRTPLASLTAWVAPRTLAVAEAARLVGIPESQLRQLNVIPPQMLVRVGSTLLVPRGAEHGHDVTEQVADHAAALFAPQPRQRRVVFKVGKQGDSVAAVARRHGVSPALVASWNKVAEQTRFKPGQTVVVMLAAAASAKSGPKLAKARVGKAKSAAVAKARRAGPSARTALLAPAPAARAPTVLR